MKERYRLLLRRQSVYYAFDNTTKTFKSLKTKAKAEATRLLLALNEAGLRQLTEMSSWLETRATGTAKEPLQLRSMFPEALREQGAFRIRGAAAAKEDRDLAAGAAETVPSYSSSATLQGISGLRVKGVAVVRGEALEEIFHVVLASHRAGHKDKLGVLAKL
jgi:hypothetical protein